MKTKSTLRLAPCLYLTFLASSCSNAMKYPTADSESSAPASDSTSSETTSATSAASAEELPVSSTNESASSISSPNTTAPIGTTPIILPVLNPVEPNTSIDGLVWYAVPNFGTELFMSGGPTQNEVIQGQDNDCTVFAALGSLVTVAPDKIKNMIRLAGKTSDGIDVYSVALFDPISRKAQTINVDVKFLVASSTNSYSYQFDLPYLDPSNQKMVLWPLLIQKAIALHYGSYDSIVRSASAQILVITGQDAVGVFDPGVFSVEPNMAISNLSNHLGHGYVVTVDSGLLTNGQPNDWSSTLISQQGIYNCALVSNITYCLAQNHEYEVLAFDGNTVTMRNPWGKNLGTPDSANGIITLPLAAYNALTDTTWSSFIPIVP